MQSHGKSCAVHRAIQTKLSDATLYSRKVLYNLSSQGGNLEQKN